MPDQPRLIEEATTEPTISAEEKAAYRERLRQKLQDPEFRAIEGFPLGTDEAILELSDPPYYTACPNPFLPNFISRIVSESQNNSERPIEPYSGELKSSSRHHVYLFHPYHTKVPPEVISQLIEHYTTPGELILDGFCGSGMTGVAALESGRNVILADLSPVATFISSVNCRQHDVRRALTEIKRIIRESQKRWGHLYRTRENGKEIEVNYFVWSDVFTCPECTFEFPFFPYGVVHDGTKVKTKKSFNCPSCNVELNVRRIQRILTLEGKKRQLVWVNAGQGDSRIKREPTQFDLDLAAEVERSHPASWYPTDKIDPNGYSAKLAQLGDKAITDVSRFLSPRNLIVFADLWERASGIEEPTIRHLVQATLTSIFTVISERQGYFGGGGGMSGNLYMPIVRMERNIYDSLRRKLTKLEKAEKAKTRYHSECIISTQSTTNLSNIPDNTVDYIYTDPPFGANIIYSEMNLILEGWLQVKTNNNPEAVIDTSRNRLFDDYANLMRRCFQEYFRVLKPGRWITVEFHNTKASVWNLIQNAIGESGFIIAQVGVLDKGSTTILADIRPGAAKYDLLISAYKPDLQFENRFKQAIGSPESAWEFVHEYLEQLPRVHKSNGILEVIAERQDYLLFDRMVAFHIQRGATVPLSAAEFYAGLRERFVERDGMFFLPEQAPEYDRARLEAEAVGQLSLFVDDEKSAIQWLRQELSPEYGGGPQTYQEIQPKFLKQLHQARHEELPELSEMLEQNFLQDEQERWYVPDPNKASDLEKLRLKALLREFNEYAKGKKKLKQFRTEAVRAGFGQAWQDHDYETIVDVAERLPESVLQEDPELLMYYDNASLRV